MFKSFSFALVSVIIVSLISLVGIFTISISERRLRRLLLFLVSFAAGSLFGGAFIHLLPEVFNEYGFGLDVSLYFLLGIILFFILEKFIHWRHCHIPTTKRHPHHLAVMNIVGDALHSFMDGVVIAASYLSSVKLGITTTTAVILHEIPQEIGDFSVLLYAGLSRVKALFFNFLSALSAVIGTILVLVLGQKVGDFSLFLLPITAGGFVYIAGSDLIPELHKACEPVRESIFQLIYFILGILVMVSLVFIE